jgi:hypothetical protein
VVGHLLVRLPIQASMPTSQTYKTHTTQVLPRRHTVRQTMAARRGITHHHHTASIHRATLEATVRLGTRPTLQDRQKNLVLHTPRSPLDLNPVSPTRRLHRDLIVRSLDHKHPFRSRSLIQNSNPTLHQVSRSIQGHCKGSNQYRPDIHHHHCLLEGPPTPGEVTLKNRK